MIDRMRRRQQLPFVAAAIIGLYCGALYSVVVAVNDGFSNNQLTLLALFWSALLGGTMIAFQRLLFALQQRGLRRAAQRYRA